MNIEHTNIDLQDNMWNLNFNYLNIQSAAVNADYLLINQFVKIKTFDNTTNFVWHIGRTSKHSVLYLVLHESNDKIILTAVSCFPGNIILCQIDYVLH